MCKAHFHPFAVIISPFHAVGCKIYNQKFYLAPNGVLAPLLKHPGKNSPGSRWLVMVQNGTKLDKMTTKLSKNDHKIVQK
jgi:hypothetical protein